MNIETRPSRIQIKENRVLPTTKDCLTALNRVGIPLDVELPEVGMSPEGDVFTKDRGELQDEYTALNQIYRYIKIINVGIAHTLSGRPEEELESALEASERKHEDLGVFNAHFKQEMIDNASTFIPRELLPRVEYEVIKNQTGKEPKLTLDEMIMLGYLRENKGTIVEESTREKRDRSRARLSEYPMGNAILQNEDNKGMFDNSGTQLRLVV